MVSLIDIEKPGKSCPHGGGNLIMSNDNWEDTQQAVINVTGKAPPNDLESAIRHTFTPGSYIAILNGDMPGVGVA